MSEHVGARPDVSQCGPDLSEDRMGKHIGEEINKGKATDVCSKTLT